MNPYPAVSPYKNWLKIGWLLVLYLVWSCISLGLYILRTGTWSSDNLSETIKLVAEIAGLALVFALMSGQAAALSKRWRWLELYRDDIHFLMPLLVWLAFLWALRFKWSTESLFLTL